MPSVGTIAVSALGEEVPASRETLPGKLEYQSIRRAIKRLLRMSEISLRRHTFGKGRKPIVVRERAVVVIVKVSGPSQSPNKAPEPTLGLVTIRADCLSESIVFRKARLAPSPSVAHL